MGLFAKRSSMTFYSSPADHYSHRVRIVLAEKGVSVEIIHVTADNQPPELLDLNPYQSVPTLVDRNLVLYEQNVMMEYLDERFPHPPLLPVYPVARARSRLWIYRIQRDWCHLVDRLLGMVQQEKVSIPLTSTLTLDEARKRLLDSLIAVSPIFDEKPFFMSDEFSLVDCCVAPMLWRLQQMDIELPKDRCKSLLKYSKRLFKRESFQASLTEEEREFAKHRQLVT